MALRIRCSGAGFGDQDATLKEDRTKRRQTKKDVREALKSLKGRKTRPIDPKEAAKGKLDIANVKDWSGGKFEDLELESFRSHEKVDPSAPLHVRLAKTLERLEMSGDLDCHVSGLLPFEKWDFEATKYAITMSNLALIHGSFEDSVKVILGSLVDQPNLGDLDINALKLFSSEQGLDRGPALKQDFQRFLEKTPLLEEANIQPSSKAKEYANLIERLRGKALEKEKDEDRITAICKLLTHGYLMRVTHLTSGSRVASAAVEKLDLIRKKAVSAARDYPEKIYDPVRSFVDNINNLGRILSEEQIDIMFEELPKAFTSNAIMFEPLARAPREIKL